MTILPPDEPPVGPPMAQPGELIGEFGESQEWLPAPPHYHGPTAITAGLTFVCWAALVILLQVVQSGGKAINILELFSSKPIWGVIAGATFISAVIAFMGWRRACGVRWPVTLKPLTLAFWVMMAFLGITLARGLPPLAQTVTVLFNTACVAVSEELMFRGVVLSAALRHHTVRRGVLITALVFGLIHVANVFATGQLLTAVLQAALAMIFGIWIGAVRVKTESVLPCIALHWAWDGLLILSGGFAALAALPAAIILGFWGWRQLSTPERLY